MATFRDIYEQTVRDLLHDRPVARRLIKDNERVVMGDPFIISLINQAEADLARKSHCIKDQGSVELEVSLIAGASEYPLHKSVVTIYDTAAIIDPDDNRRVKSLVTPESRREFNPYGLDTSVVGVPNCYRQYSVSGEQQGVVLRPIPTIDEAGWLFKFNCYRTPLLPYTVPTNTSAAVWTQVSEIPEPYCYRLAYYVIAIGLGLNQDLDAEEKDAAKVAAALWQQVILDVKAIDYERDARQFSNTFFDEVIG